MTAETVADALTAATDTFAPPISWFRNPNLDGPTPHTVTKDGRVYGHMALWDSQHRSFPGKNIRPPRSKSDYAYFHVGSQQVVDDNGNEVRVPVGHLTCDTGHADLDVDAQGAKSFYDNTGTLAASVCAGEDEYGIWYSGAVDPELPELTLRRFSGCSLSGDWRGVNGALELTAALSVPTPGFAVPRARVASGGPEPTALVAAGALLPRDVNPKEIVVTVNAATEAKSEPAAEPEATVAAAEPAAPSFETDQVVNLPSKAFTGLVASINDGVATVSVDVPVADLADAGVEGRMALSASARERHMEARLNKALSTIEQMQTSMEGLVASAEMKRNAADAITDLSSIPTA